MMLVAGFGWAQARPREPELLQKPRQGMALTALAGPASNLLLALLLLIPARLIYTYAHYSVFNQTALDFLTSTAALSIGLGLFNLIPIPPLDGSKVLAVLLPERAYRWLMRYERFGIFALWLLVALGVGGRYMSLAIRWVYTLFCRIVGF